VGLDACFFCLGVSSAGMTPEQYRHLTYEFTVSCGVEAGMLEPGDDLRLCVGRRHRQL